MPTDRARLPRVSPTPGARRRAGALLALLALALPPAASGQVPVDAGTRVRAIRFTGVHALAVHDLRDVLRTRDRGAAYGLRVVLGRLPLVPDPAPVYFSPIELQRDVVRLRRRYEEAGFPHADVRYEVAFDEKHDLLDITFLVDEGAPVRVAAVTVVGGDSARAALSRRDARRWASVLASARKLRGHRLELERVRSRQQRLRQFWQDHGHPGAEVRARFEADSSSDGTIVRFEVSPGPFARFGEVEVEGHQALSERSIRRELPFRVGDPYSAAEIAEGRSELQQLEIVRLASFELAAADTGDLRSLPPGSAIPLRLRVVEAKPRFMSGEVGYVTDAGLSAEARWSHRNFTGGGRTLTLSAAAQTGLLAITDDPDERYRGTVSLLQPYVYDRRLSTVLSPYVEHRDDQNDRTLEVGSNATLVFRPHPDATASLDYRIARKRIYEYRLGSAASGRTDLYTLIVYASQGLLDSLGTTQNVSIATLSGNLRRLDRQASPRRGFILRPALQLTVPPPLATLNYWQAEGAAYGFLPAGRRAVLAGRVEAGRIFPFGKSVAGPGESPEVKFLQLRDALFTAGGSGDVRGWAQGQLGPKFPDIRFRQEGDSIRLEADGYVPVGGLDRFTFSIELRLPFPGLGPQFGTHLFLDGGRVWTADANFPGTESPGQERMFYATGGGIDLFTPVGPIRIGAGYKLNPSVLDLADAQEVFDALASGGSLDDLPQHARRRWQFYLSIGSTF